MEERDSPKELTPWGMCLVDSFQFFEKPQRRAPVFLRKRQQNTLPTHRHNAASSHPPEVEVQGHRFGVGEHEISVLLQRRKSLGDSRKLGLAQLRVTDREARLPNCKEIHARSGAS